MNKEQPNNIPEQNQKIEKKKLSKKITGLDIDKAEYQEIVLSHTNIPGKDYFRKNYYY